MKIKIRAGAFETNSSSDCDWMEYCDEHKQQKIVEQTFNDLDKEDLVNHPSHYTWLKDKCGLEVIDITKHFDFLIGNVLKYVFRAGHKDDSSMTNIDKEIQDLEKAEWYLRYKIDELKKSRK